MGAPLQFDWGTIRAEYEAGASQAGLSKKHGVSRAAIQQHIAKEEWKQDIVAVEAALQLKVAEKLAGIAAGYDPQKKEDALDAEAARKADVVTRHRTEWVEHKKLVKSAISNQDFDMAKLAKITSETLKIRQEGERKAWGLDKEVSNTGVTININGDDVNVL